MRRPVIRTPFTDRDKALIRALAPARINYFPGSSAKRFARTMNHDLEHRETLGMTDKQRHYLIAVGYTYRRQLPTFKFDMYFLNRTSDEKIEFYRDFYDELADFRHLEHDDDDLGEVVASDDQLELL